MKLLKLLEQVLQETGDTTNVKTYQYQKTAEVEDYDSESYSIKFTTESNINYIILIHKIDFDQNNIWRLEIEFGVENEKEGDFPASYDFKSVVNKGEMYKVMATVIKAVKEELEESEKKGQNIVTIVIEPSKNFETDLRRANLYMAYIQKNMPKGSRIEKNSDMSKIEIDLSPSYLM